MGDPLDRFVKPERLPGESDAQYAYRCRRLEKGRYRLPGESEDAYVERMRQREELRVNKQTRRDAAREGQPERRRPGRPRREAQPRPAVKSARRSEVDSSPKAQLRPRVKMQSTLSKPTTDSVTDNNPNDVQMGQDPEPDPASGSNVIDFSKHLQHQERKRSNSQQDHDTGTDHEYEPDCAVQPVVQDSDLSGGGFGGSLIRESEGSKAPRIPESDPIFPEIADARKSAEKRLSEDTNPDLPAPRIPYEIYIWLKTSIHEIVDQVATKLYHRTSDVRFSLGLTKALEAELKALVLYATEEVKFAPQLGSYYHWPGDEELVTPETLSGFSFMAYLARGYSLALVDVAHEARKPSWWATPDEASQAALLRVWDQCLGFADGDVEKGLTAYMQAATLYAMQFLVRGTERSAAAFERSVYQCPEPNWVYRWTRQDIYCRWVTVMGLPFELGRPGEPLVERPPGFDLAERQGFVAGQVKRSEADVLAARARALAEASGAQDTPEPSHHATTAT